MVVVHPSAQRAISSRHAVFAVGLLLALGFVDFALRRHLGDYQYASPVPPGSLAKLPTTIGQWTSKDVALSERIIQATDTDDHVNRIYRRPNKPPMALWFTCGIRTRDLLPHRPEVCYPSAGWTIDSIKQLTLRTPVGDRSVSLLAMHRGGLDPATALIVSYYIIGKETTPDVTGLRSTLWNASSRGDYVAQVQLAAFGDPTSPPDAQELIALGQEMFVPLVDTVGSIPRTTPR